MSDREASIHQLAGLLRQERGRNVVVLRARVPIPSGGCEQVTQPLPKMRFSA